MIVEVRMRVCVVFLLAVLGCGLAEARNVTKCELREKMMKAMKDLPDKEKQAGLTGENFVAKTVCYAEMASALDTSVVHELTSMMEAHLSQGGRHNPGRRSRPPQPRTRGRQPRGQPPQSGEDEDEEVWTAYGLFQLSNHLACNDSRTPSPNICGIDCINLLDDDIQDDIICLLKIFTNLVEDGFGAANIKKLGREIRFILQDDCRNEQASEYFSECLEK